MIRLFLPLNLLLLAVLVVATAAGYLLIPAGAPLPARWGLDLQPTEFLPRETALLQMPAGVLLIWGLLWLAGRYGNRARQPQQTRALEIVLPVLTGLLTAIQLAVVIVGLRAVPL